jgi:hypothetical protein
MPLFADSASSRLFALSSLMRQPELYLDRPHVNIAYDILDIRFAQRDIAHGRDRGDARYEIACRYAGPIEPQHPSRAFSRHDGSAGDVEP